MFHLLPAKLYDRQKKDQGLLLLEVSKKGGTFALDEIVGYFQDGKLLFPEELPLEFEHLIERTASGLIYNDKKAKKIQTSGLLVKRVDLMGVINRPSVFIGKEDVQKYLFVKETVFDDLKENEFFFFKNKLCKTVLPAEGRKGFAYFTGLEGKGMWEISAASPVLKIIEGSIEEQNAFSNREEAELSMIINHLQEEEFIDVLVLSEKIPAHYEVYSVGEEECFIPLENPPKNSKFSTIEASSYIDPQTGEPARLVMTIKGIILKESVAKRQNFAYRYLESGVTFNLYKFKKPKILQSLRTRG